MRTVCYFTVLILVISPIVYSQEYTADPYTVILWHLNELNASDSTIDVSGNNNYGIPNGTSVADGKFGKARQINIAGDYIEAMNSSAFDFRVTKQFTCEFWIKFDSLPAAGQRIIGKWGTGFVEDDEWQVCLYGSSSKVIFFNVSDGIGVWFGLYGNTIIETNTWYNVGLVWNGDSNYAAIYINGALDTASHSVTSTINFTGHPFRIGWDSSEPSEPSILGSIDEVRISNKARTSDEFHALFIPSISSIVPTSGPIGTSVIISGTNFNSTPSGNIVWFGGVKAEVVSASVASLAVKVPPGASFGPIIVTNISTNLSANSNEHFLPTRPGMESMKASKFSNNVSFQTSSKPHTIAYGDLNNDGKLEVVVAIYDGKSISVFNNFSDAGSIDTNTLSNRFDLPTAGNTHDVALADIDGDGKLDILCSSVVAAYTDAYVCVFRNNYISGNLDATSFDTRVDLVVADGPRSLTIADFDNDGKPDIASSIAYANTISVFKNTSTPGALSFGSKVDFSAGYELWKITASDLNGDGWNDIAVVSSSENNIEVFCNRAQRGIIDAGSFAPRVNYSVPTNVTGILAYDIDGDGKKDLISTSVTGEAMTIFHNTTSPDTIDVTSFSSPIIFLQSYPMIYAAVSDLDGDGKPDIAVRGYSSDYITVYKNMSTPGHIDSLSLQRKFDLSSLAGYGIALADINNDGRCDILSTSSDNNVLTIHQNNLHPIPNIVSVTDIPNDQGGKVRIKWDKIYLDSAGITPQITSYGVWRKIPPGMSVTKRLPSPMSILNDTLGVLYDYLGTVNATQSPSYNFVAQTLQDSSESGTNAETFLITAHTSDPNVYYISDAAMGYSVDNIAPSAVTSLAAVWQTGPYVDVSWDDNPKETDFQRYEIYKSNTKNFVPSLGLRIVTTLSPQYQDADVTDGYRYYYQVYSVDSHGNKSEVRQVSIHGTSIPRIISLNNNWNMVSVPMDMDDYSKESLFPTVVSSIFKFDGSYQTITTLENGTGYWAKFDYPQDQTHNGFYLKEVRINVKDGWNMIGSLSETVPVTNITSEPAGMVTSQLFEYSGSYQMASNLNPGKGYWIKVSGTGTLILSNGSEIIQSNRINITKTDELPPLPPFVNSTEQLTPKEYVLEQNFPNPFNPTTVIKYGLPEDANVTLSVFNTLGQEVALLASGFQKAGYYEVKFDGSGLTSGVYFYRIQSNNYLETKKLLLMK